MLWATSIVWVSFSVLLLAFKEVEAYDLRLSVDNMWITTDDCIIWVFSF